MEICDVPNYRHRCSMLKYEHSTVIFCSIVVIMFAYRKSPVTEKAPNPRRSKNQNRISSWRQPERRQDYGPPKHVTSEPTSVSTSPARSKRSSGRANMRSILLGSAQKERNLHFRLKKRAMCSLTALFMLIPFVRRNKRPLGDSNGNKVSKSWPHFQSWRLGSKQSILTGLLYCEQQKRIVQLSTSSPPFSTSRL